MGTAHPRDPGPQARYLAVEPGANQAVLDVVGRIGSSLAAGGFTVTADSVAGRQCVIARQAQFRLRWMATRLHTFVLVAVFKADATPDHLDRFLEEAVAYARTVKGGLPLGLQTGVCAVAVAVVDSAGPIGAWATTAHGHTFAALGYPVLVDVAGGQVMSPTRMVLGAVYHPWLKGLVDAHVVPALDQRQGF